MSLPETTYTLISTGALIATAFIAFKCFSSFPEFSDADNNPNLSNEDLADRHIRTLCVVISLKKYGFIAAGLHSAIAAALIIINYGSEITSADKAFTIIFALIANSFLIFALYGHIQMLKGFRLLSRLESIVDVDKVLDKQIEKERQRNKNP